MKLSIGIEDISIYIPSTRMSLCEMAGLSGLDEKELYEKIGVFEKPIAIDEGSTDMGIKAVTSLLEDRELDPREINYIIFCSTGNHDKKFWSPAAKIQNVIGAKNAYSFEISNGCNAGNNGLYLAKNFLNQAGDKKKYVLLVMSDVLSKLVNYNSQSHVSLYNFSDASAAVLISNQSPQNKILTSEFLTDASFSDYLSIPENQKTIEYQHSSALKESLKKAYLNNYLNTINKVLLTSRIHISQIQSICINQGDYKLIGKISDALGIDSDKIIRTYPHLGHMGSVDIFFGLRKKLISSLYKPGDYVLLASSAIGFSWGATLLQI